MTLTSPRSEGASVGAKETARVCSDVPNLGTYNNQNELCPVSQVLKPKTPGRSPTVVTIRGVVWTLLAGTVFALLFWPVARIDHKTAQGILPGMTFADVEHIIGASPGWHDGAKGVYVDIGPPFEKDGWLPILGHNN